MAAALQTAKFIRITGAEGVLPSAVNGLYIESSTETLVWEKYPHKNKYLYRATDGEWFISGNAFNKNERKPAGAARSVGSKLGLPTDVQRWEVNTAPPGKAEWQKQELRVCMHMCIAQTCVPTCG